MSLIRPCSHCNGQALAFTSYKGCSVRGLCLGPRGLPAPPLLSEVYLLPVSLHRQENLGVAAATPGLLSPYPSSGPQPHAPQSFLSQLKCSALTAALPLEPSKALSSVAHPSCHDNILACPVCISAISTPWWCSVTFSPAVPFLQVSEPHCSLSSLWLLRCCWPWPCLRLLVTYRWASCPLVPCSSLLPVGNG